jgi:hypothetical protein
VSNVIDFKRPKPRPAAEPKLKPAPKFNPDNRNEWVEAAKAVWADPANWRTSKKGNRYVAIDRLSICVVINRTDEGYWSWEIRRRDGREPMSSNWTYLVEQSARDEALDAVLVLA